MDAMPSSPLERPTAPEPHHKSRAVMLLVAAGIVLIAGNLRPAVTSIASLLTEIRLDVGLSSTMAAFLTAAPVLCFGLVAPFSANCHWRPR